MLVTHYERNESGRDFIMGDLHGCVDALVAQLKGIGFHTGRDRLFSVGDLVDRGRDSYRAVGLLNEPWFHAVRGNHEQMAIEYELGRIDPDVYAANGGAWFMAMSRQERTRDAVAFEFLPLAMEVDVGERRVGIVHADCPVGDWRTFVRTLEDPSEAHQASMLARAAIWSRARLHGCQREGVAGIDLVVVGHTPVERVTSLGNVLYIDTGAVYGGSLTVLDLARTCAAMSPYESERVS